MIVALALVVGTAIPAVAAQQALPGEALYGWKKGSEGFLVLFDRDIRARHRLNELESLFSSGRDLGGALTAAEVELAEVEDEALLARWSILLADLEESAGDEGEAEDQGSGGGVGVAPADDDQGESASDDGEEAAEEEEESDDGEESDEVEDHDEEEESADGEESDDDEPDPDDGDDEEDDS